MGAHLSKRWNFRTARSAGYLGIRRIDARRLLRLTRFPENEPYWGKGKAYRFDDPAQVYGTTYSALDIRVAFAETILHQDGYFTGNQWVIDEASIMQRHVVSYARPANPDLLVADFTGASLKALGLNNDLCSSNDYRRSMAVSSALHAQVPDVDGIMYVSRQMNTGLAVALFERSEVVLGGEATRLVEHVDFGRLLSLFNVAILPASRAP
jgi:RES domain